MASTHLTRGHCRQPHLLHIFLAKHNLRRDARSIHIWEWVERVGNTGTLCGHACAAPTRRACADSNLQTPCRKTWRWLGPESVPTAVLLAPPPPCNYGVPLSRPLRRMLHMLRARGPPLTATRLARGMSTPPTPERLSAFASSATAGRSQGSGFGRASCGARGPGTTQRRRGGQLRKAPEGTAEEPCASGARRKRKSSPVAVGAGARTRARTCAHPHARNTWRAAANSGRPPSASRGLLPANALENASDSRQQCFGREGLRESQARDRKRLHR